LSELWPIVAARAAGLTVDVAPAPGFRIQRLFTVADFSRLY